MTEAGPKREVCTCTNPELRVYSTTYTLEQKVQYLRCLKCQKTAGQKRLPNDLAQRVAALEVLILEWQKNFPNSERR